MVLGRLCGAALLLCALAGCGGELQKLSDSKLRGKAAECKYRKQSRAKAVVCDQVRKECDRRDIHC